MFPFHKGQGQAPGYNKPASLRETLALARKHSPEAMMTLIRNLRHEDGRISTMSASLILERALGKAKELPEVSPQARIDLSRLTDQELQVLLGLVQSGRLQPAPHAEDVESPLIEVQPIPAAKPNEKGFAVE